MNGDFPVDMSEVLESIEAADVIAIYLPFLGKTLLADTRSDAFDGPMVKVVPVARSTEDRFRSLKRLRPRFPRPDSIAIVPWAQGVRSLETLGVWSSIVRRCSTPGTSEEVNEWGLVFRTLLELELEEKVAAVTGESYRTIWSAQEG